MGRVVADMHCDNCEKNFVWTEGTPMKCPFCLTVKEVVPVTVETLRRNREKIEAQPGGAVREKGR